MSNLGIVNVAVQVLPLETDKHPYRIVDKAIEIIEASGLKYEVCPFETVIEGPYDEVMGIIKQLQVVCVQEGANHMVTNLKIQISAGKDVRIADKIEKYR